MGYPMDYKRVINRNYLDGNYNHNNSPHLNDNLISGDLRRLEKDSRDDWHLRRYAETTGLTSEQVKQVLDIFLEILN